MARGGKRTPRGPRPPGGPGKFSQRTDGNQPIATPGLRDPSMQYGDVQQLRAAQHAAPIPQAGALQAPPPPSGAAPLARGNLPEFVTNSPSARPHEPATEGLSTGPGAGPEILPVAGPDPREQILQSMWQMFGNQQALDMLNAIRNQKAQAAQTPDTSMGGPATIPGQTGAPVTPGG